MTDRELLEKAAKAIGMPKAPRGCEIPDNLPVLFLYEGKEWSPLTDDGDALRLAHGLNVPVSIDISKELTTVSGWTFDIDEPHGNDPLAATRRAIVRAAAAIGNEM